MRRLRTSLPGRIDWAAEMAAGIMRPVAALVTGVGDIGAPLALALLDRGEGGVGFDNFFSTHPEQLGPLTAHPRFKLVWGSISDGDAVRAVVQDTQPAVVY